MDLFEACDQFAELYAEESFYYKASLFWAAQRGLPVDLYTAIRGWLPWIPLESFFILDPTFVGTIRFPYLDSVPGESFF